MASLAEFERDLIRDRSSQFLTLTRPPRGPTSLGQEGQAGARQASRRAFLSAHCPQRGQEQEHGDEQASGDNTPNWPTRGPVRLGANTNPNNSVTDQLAVAAALVASPFAAPLGTVGGGVGRSFATDAGASSAGAAPSSAAGTCAASAASAIPGAGVVVHRRSRCCRNRF